MPDFYPIVGIQDGLDPDDKKELRKVQVRMELDDWYQSPQLLYVNQRALFFPAFWRFSQLSPQDKLSWFQIAGKTKVTSDNLWSMTLIYRHSQKTVRCMG